MALPLAHSKAAMVGAIVTICGLVGFNAFYWLWYPALDRSGKIVVDQQLPVGLSVPQVPVETADDRLLMAVLLVVAAMAVGVVAWVLAGIVERRQQRHRDSRRRADLAMLQQGLEAYRAQVGHYPVGSGSRQRAIPAAALGYEWENLGFPSGNEMRKYVADWPVVDPLISYDQQQQKNQYLYYPLSDGRGYWLYAHLERPDDKKLIDFGPADGLPRAWGAYTYKVGRPLVDQTSELSAESAVTASPASAMPNASQSENTPAPPQDKLHE